MSIRPFQALAYRRVAFFKPPSAFALQACRDLPMWRWLTVRAGVSLTLRLICGHLLRSLLPFLTCIYETLLDLEIYKMCWRPHPQVYLAMQYLFMETRNFEYLTLAEYQGYDVSEMVSSYRQVTSCLRPSLTLSVAGQYLDYEVDQTDDASLARASIAWLGRIGAAHSGLVGAWRQYLGRAADDQTEACWATTAAPVATIPGLAESADRLIVFVPVPEEANSYGTYFHSVQAYIIGETTGRDPAALINLRINKFGRSRCSTPTRLPSRKEAALSSIINSTPPFRTARAC